jgi:hypothetical protein
MATNPSMSGLSALALLLGSPYGILEFGANSVGMSRSFHFTWIMIKRNPMKSEIRPQLSKVRISIGLLVVATVVQF